MQALLYRFGIYKYCSHIIRKEGKCNDENCGQCTRVVALRLPAFSGGKMLARRRGTPLRQGKQSVWTPVFNGIAVENLVHKRIIFSGGSPNPLLQKKQR